MTVGAELDRIRKQHNGVLQAEHVVAYARTHKKSALHGRFEWDNAKAAEAHRLQTARQLIGVHIRVIENGGREIPMRTFFSPVPDSGPRPSGYVSTAEKLQHPDGRTEVALAQLKRMRSHYESYPLDELAPVVEVIDRLRVELEGRLQKKAA
jgi:hypothetical protein